MCGCCDGTDDQKPQSGNPLKKNVCCTDILFLIIFVGFWAGMIYIAAFSIAQGDVWRLVYGYDSFGNTCNKPTNPVLNENVSMSGMSTEDKEFLIYFDIFDPLDAMQICVKECPDRYIETPQEFKDYYKDTGINLCKYDFDPNSAVSNSFDRRGPCPDLPIYKSFDILNRCVPDPRNASIKDVAYDVVQGINADDIFKQVLADLYNSWKEILALCGIGLGIALLMVFAIRFLASVIVWIIVILAIVGSIAGTAFLWWTYAEARGTDENLDIPVLSVDISNERAFLVFAIVATVLTVILLLILLVMRKRISLVVALFHEAGKCIGSVPLLLLQPVWTFIILILFFTYWIIIMGFISTAGKPAVDYKEGFERIEFEKDTTLRVFWWYHIIGLIWTSEFILACQQMVIAGAVAVWYFTRNKDELSCTVGKSVSRLILHHIGSVALGAFIITLVKLPRLILMYIQRKCEGSTNKVAQCCLKCCICCLWCLEKLLKFLNQNAYTVIAIEGKSFCPAAKKAFMVIANNVLRVAAINSVGDFVLFLGKIGVMAATAAIGVVWLKNKAGLHYYAIPVLLVCVFAFFIAHCFLSIYEMVVDTLLLCFCEDCQLNDGTPERQYYMSPSLMEYVKGASAKLDEEKKGKKKEGDMLDGEEPPPTDN